MEKWKNEVEDMKWKWEIKPKTKIKIKNKKLRQEKSEKSEGNAERRPVDALDARRAAHEGNG